MTPDDDGARGRVVRGPSPEGWRTLGRAAAAGLLLAAALPPWGWWPLAFPGVAVLDRLLDGQPAGRRFRRGFLVGLALLVPTYSWMAAFTPPGYVIACAAYSAMLGGAVALVPARAPARWLALPAALVLWDAVRGRWPFGGVPISTLALGQVGSPLVVVARAGGPLLLGLAAASVGVAVSAAWAWWRRPPGDGPTGDTGLVAAGVALVAVGVLVLAGVASPRAHDTGTLRVGLVQGGGVQGTTVEDVPPSVVFQRHLEASKQLPPGLDAVLWPEDVAEVAESFPSTPEGLLVAAEARRLHTTILVGIIEDVSDTAFRNAQIAFAPDGSAVDRYEKVRRVPFGEYTPLRSLLEAVAGGAVRHSDALPGADPPVLRTPAGTFGVSTSWEVFFADRARAAIRAGGEVLTNPTNGASFHGPIVQSQQLASTRLRAIETDRWTIQAAPTGYSAIVTPDGEVVQRTGIGEQRVLLGEVARRAGQTWAVRFGDWPALALGALLLAGARRTARTASKATTPDAPLAGPSGPAS